MRSLFYTALCFAILMGMMGIFFGFIIYHSGTEIRDMNTDFILIMGMIVVSGSGAIIFGTPVSSVNFWNNLKQQREGLIRIHEEEQRLNALRDKYEELLGNTPSKPRV